MTEPEPVAVESDVAPLPDAEPEQSDNRPRLDEGDVEELSTYPGPVLGVDDDAYDPDRDGVA